MTTEAGPQDTSRSVPAGRRVRLPRGAEPPYDVFINGVEQHEGADYDVRGGQIVFRRPILKEGKLGLVRWASMFFGLAGSYRRNESVDVQYRRDGKPELASDLEVLPD